MQRMRWLFLSVAVSFVAAYLLWPRAANPAADVLTHEQPVTKPSASTDTTDCEHTYAGCDEQAHVRVTDASYHPLEVRDPALGILVDRRLSLNERVPPDITSRIPTVRYEADLPVLLSVLGDPTDLDTVRNEVANLLHRSSYPRLREVLVGVLANPQERPRFRGWAIQHLGGLLVKGPYAEDKPLVLARLREALSDQHLEVRREALLALVRQNDGAATETTREWLADMSPGGKEVRDLAIRCAGELGLRDQIPNVRAFNRNPDEVVRIAALVVLSQWGDQESRSACEEAAASESLRLQRCGKAALERLNTTNQQHAHP